MLNWLVFQDTNSHSSIGSRDRSCQSRILRSFYVSVWTCRCVFRKKKKVWTCGWVVQYAIQLTIEIHSFPSWAVNWAKMETLRSRRTSVCIALLPFYPFDSAMVFNRTIRVLWQCGAIASDFHWGKPCGFTLWALGATCQDQCLCGCIQKPHGILCPWAEIIWALQWITDPNPQQTVPCATQSCRRATHGVRRIDTCQDEQWRGWA